jgi:hypothetical protein
MGARFSDGEGYLRMYPRLLKWINVCTGCGAKGYKPEMPPHNDQNFGVQNLRRYFKPLALNQLDRCEQCAPYGEGRT